MAIPLDILATAIKLSLARGAEAIVHPSYSAELHVLMLRNNWSASAREDGQIVVTRS